MKYIETKDYNLEIGPLSESSLDNILKNRFSLSKKIILVDENTHEFCLSALITAFDELSNAEVMVLPSGEESKVIDIAINVWEAFTEYEVGRNDLIINLGGGMITDLGGFIASCYKRGCSFINIPTTLLAMVDASIGGKTGVNLGNFKNQIGVFSNPIGVFVDMSFLESLPSDQLMSGYAEMIKHGIISDANLFQKVCASLESDQMIDEDLLIRSIEVKHEVVKKDPFEDGLRKVLNFGHTIGHAIEGYHLDSGKFTHGHAIAIGMIMEAFISMRLAGLSEEDYFLIESFILKHYDLPTFSDQDIQSMIKMLYNDKKNNNGKIKCSLIKKIGKCIPDVQVDSQFFLEAFLHFKGKQLNLN